MKLLLETDRTALSRYANVARASKGDRCGQGCPGTERTCSRRRGHGGPHVAHGFLGKVLAAWDSAAEDRRRMAAGDDPASALARAAAVKRRLARRTLRPKAGLAERMAGWVLRVLADPEQLLLLIFFLAFVGFAVHWLTLLM